jgi:hypothetical protein
MLVVGELVVQEDSFAFRPPQKGGSGFSRPFSAVTPLQVLWRNVWALRAGLNYAIPMTIAVGLVAVKRDVAVHYPPVNSVGEGAVSVTQLLSST